MMRVKKGIPMFKDLSRKFISSSLLLIIFLGIIKLSSLTPLNINPARGEVKLLSQDQQGLSEISTPLETSSYLMIDKENQKQLLAKNDDVQRPPASTVKLLTGMVVMEKLKEKDEIRVGEEIFDIEGSKIGLQPGDRILVEELLTALYLASANDAATILAIAAYGSVDEFVEVMNETAQKLGATHSEFKTPHGLPYPGQYTTARDLTQIALAFVEKQDLMKYVQMQKASVEWTQSNGTKMSVPVSNTNQILGIYPGDIGLKTGTTTEAGQCLVTYITRPDGDILVTLLGSINRYAETIELLDQGISMIRTRSALNEITSHPDSLVSAPGFFAP